MVQKAAPTSTACADRKSWSNPNLRYARRVVRDVWTDLCRANDHDQFNVTGHPHCGWLELRVKAAVRHAEHPASYPPGDEVQANHPPQALLPPQLS
jgi:hypothetical protein